MTNIKLSQISNGGSFVPSTDQVVTVRNGNSDVLTALGTAATQSTGTFAQVANNLSDLSSASTARTNLGLGTAATQNTSAFLQPSNNLSDVASVATAITNLGLNTPEISLTAAATVNLGSAGSPNILVNGAATITSFGSSASTNAPDYILRFNGNVTITNNNTSLICPNASNLSLIANDYIRVRYLGSGDWIVLDVFQFGGSGSLSPYGTITNGSLAFWQTGTSLSSGNLTGDVVTSGNTATIQPGSVTLAKMAGGGTDYSLIGYNATGAPYNVPFNANPNLVLNTNGLGINATIYNVKDYGAKGDGVTNDNAAIAACIAACLASTYGGIVYFPQGVYVVTQQFANSLANPSGNGGQSLYFKGDGAHVSLIQWTGSTGGISISFYSAAPYKGLIGAEGLTFQTLTAGGGNGLSLIELNATANIGPKKQIIHCAFVGAGTSYWTEALLLDGVANPVLFDLLVTGYQSGLTFDGTGLQIQNSQNVDATNYIINSCNFFQLNLCINATSGIQGIQLCGASQFVGSNYGIKWVENNGTELEPLLQVIGCDFNNAVYGILTTNIAQCIIQGNLFYRYYSGSSGNNWAATFIDNANSAGADDANIISGNTILGYGTTATGTANGIVAVNCEYSLIASNRIDNVATGVWLQSPSSHNIVRGNQVTNFSSYDVYDQGTANLVQASLAGYGALVYMNSNQSVSSSSSATLTFGTALYDPLSMWNGSTGFTIPAGANKIILSCGVEWASNGTGDRNVSMQVGGSGFHGSGNDSKPACTTQVTYHSVSSAELPVTSGQLYTISVNQDSGSALNVLAANATWFAIKITA